MESLEKYIIEAGTPTSKQKTPYVYKGRTATYRPGMFGVDWDTYSKSRKYNALYNEATFAFNYDTNTLEVECPGFGGTRMVHYRFKLKRSTFEDINVLTPQDLDYHNHRGLNLTQMIDVLDIACWTFNNMPEPSFEK